MLFLKMWEKLRFKKINKKRELNIGRWLVSRQLWFYDLNIDQLSLKSTRRISIIFHIMLFLKTLKICNRKLLTGVWKTAKWRLGANIQTQFSLFITKRWDFYFFGVFRDSGTAMVYPVDYFDKFLEQFWPELKMMAILLGDGCCWLKHGCCSNQVKDHPAWNTEEKIFS